jgi:hypothetical protein
MTLSSQLDAASSSRKPSKKSSRQQKKTSTPTPPPNADVKTNIRCKDKSLGTSDKKDTLSPSKDNSLRRTFSIRKHLSNLVNSGGSSLKRSLSFGKGLNENTPRKPWNASLQSLREDGPSNDEEIPASSSDVRDIGTSVFDSRKLVTRSQSLLVHSTRTKDVVDAKKYKVSCFLYQPSEFYFMIIRIVKSVCVHAVISFIFQV